MTALGKKIGLLSSTALLEMTGLSRATLNNYIKMGMIPSPIVKKPDDPSIRAKRIGYFQDSVMGTLEKIKLYKKKGYSMTEIVSLLSLRSSEDHLPKVSEIGPGMFTQRCKEGAKESEMIFDEDSSFSLSILVADLQDAAKICTELPPEEYFDLIRQIRNTMDGLLKKYHGITGKHAFEVMICYFPEKIDSGYLMNSILCALELRESMLMLSDRWRVKKGWFNDLFINIGINEGKEYFESIPVLSNIELTVFGDSINGARRLSEIARYGSVWTTKNLMIRLSEAERRKLSYGIRRRQQEREILIENAYSRVVDLIPQECHKSDNLMDIATLAVTEILHAR